MLTGSRRSDAISTTAVGERQIRRMEACSDCIPGVGSHSLTTSVTRSKASVPDRLRPPVTVYSRSGSSSRPGRFRRGLWSRPAAWAEW